MDEDRHEAREFLVDKLLVAQSPFVYIPEYGGIAYQHVWNQIEQRTFVRRFASIMSAKKHDFFVTVEIDPVAEYERFIARLQSLKRITKLRATVYPPNPLFGPLWKSLKEYLDRRQLAELKLQETSEAKGVVTNIQIALSLPPSKTQSELDITDAAVLMAADGYGKATIEGHDKTRRVVIRTADINRSFVFESDPKPEALYKEAKAVFEEIAKQRYHQH